MGSRAEKLKVYVQREADGRILVVSSDRTSLEVAEGDTITEQDVWIEIPE